MQKQSHLSRLMSYAGKHRILTWLSWLLSAASALLALIPFWYIWRIIHDILEVSPDFSRARNITHYGWMAVLFAVLSVIVYIAALMCSHLSAFRVAANIRKELMRHIASLPLGTVESYGSGRLRRIVNTSSTATENYLAHRLPDKAGAIATPLGLLVLLLVFDWRLGLLSLIPAALGFLIMTKMTGADMEQKMKEYQDALADMSNEAVEYVRGIPVVKTFGQTIFSFRRFKASIDNYEKWVISYTRALRLPMMFYTTAINAVFAFLITGGILLSGSGVTDELLLNLIFYIVITPVIGTTLTKIMFMSEDSMIVRDAIGRIDQVLREQPLPEPTAGHTPSDASGKDIFIPPKDVHGALHGDSVEVEITDENHDERGPVGRIAGRGHCEGEGTVIAAGDGDRQTLLDRELDGHGQIILGGGLSDGVAQGEV